LVAFKSGFHTCLWKVPYRVTLPTLLGEAQAPLRGRPALDVDFDRHGLQVRLEGRQRDRGSFTASGSG
jgi:hypothetical protein